MSDLNLLVEKLSNLTVLQAADLAKLLEEKWGVSGAAMMAPAASSSAGAPGAVAVEEKTEFSVVLLDAGAQKINVIKELRTICPGLGLVEAKTMAESAPKVVKEGASKEEAAKIKAQLEAAGAKVELK